MKTIQYTVLVALVLLSTIVQANEIDNLIEKKLKDQGIKSSEICTEQVFVRRVFLTTIGRIPKEMEAKKFLDSKSIQKREKLIDSLLQSSDFVDFQVLKWGDLLRIKSEFPSNLWPNAVQAYNRWLTVQIRDNVPYNTLVQNLLTGSGSNFRIAEVNFYRAFQVRSPQNINENISLLFLGTRTAPKECEVFFKQLKYKKTDEWKEEILFVDLDIVPVIGSFKMPDGVEITINKNTDLRQTYVNWLTSSKNDAFSKVIVNRIWYWLLGRGIVDEPDNFCESNPPSNPELLVYLQKEFIKSNFDMKHIFRIILNSNTYQSSSKTNKSNQLDVTYFSHFQLQRLTAEQIIDAIGTITGIPDRYYSRVPEPFTFLPPEINAKTLGDGTVSSPSLEMFGRPSRDVSFENDRNNQLTMKQVLFLLNSSVVFEKIRDSKNIKELTTNGTSKEIIHRIYLTVLSRYPTDKEIQVTLSYFETSKNKYEATKDIMWALINTKEFLFHH